MGHGSGRLADEGVTMPNRARGMVTVELAIGLLALAAVTAVLVWVVHLAALQMRLTDAALRGARLYSRGEPVTRSEVAAYAPDGAQVSIRRDDDLVQVEVSLGASIFGLGEVPIVGSATYPMEPGE